MSRDNVLSVTGRKVKIRLDGTGLHTRFWEGKGLGPLQHLFYLYNRSGGGRGIRGKGVV